MRPTPLDEPDVEPVLAPLVVVPGGLRESRGDSGLRAPDTYGITWDDECDLRAWDVVRDTWWQSGGRYYRNPSGRGPRSLRRRYGCPVGCEAARRASWLVHLPWTALVSLSAPPGKFWDRWYQWTGLETWMGSLGDRLDFFRLRPFWSYVFAPQRNGHVHAHLLVGNISLPDVRSAVKTWPGNRFARKVSPITDKAGGRWPVLHYVFAQTKNRGLHATGYVPLLLPPRDSWNLDAWTILTDYQIAATTGRLARRWRTPMTTETLIILLAWALHGMKIGKVFEVSGSR
jgi:hypothetical protein